MQIDRPITIAVTLFIILLLIFFLVVPEYNTFETLQTQLGETTAEYNAEFVYYNAIANTYDQLQSHQDDISKIDDALPQDPTLGNTIYILQEAAKQNGLILKDLSLSKSSSNSSATSGGGVTNIVFSMDLTGNYSSLGNFIISLEKSSRIFEITSISFGSASGSVSSFSLQIQTQSYSAPKNPSASSRLNRF